MSFFKVPIHPDVKCLLCEFHVHVVELDSLVSLIPSGGTSSVLDMETWCSDWDEFLKNSGACQTEAMEKHIALPLTTTVSAKGDECVAMYLRMQDAIILAWKEAAEHEKKMEEKQRITKEEEGCACKAKEDKLTCKTVEAEEQAQETAEAEEQSWKTAEAEELTCKTEKAVALVHWIFKAAQENEKSGEDEEEESLEEEQRTGSAIVIKQKTGHMSTNHVALYHHPKPCIKCMHRGGFTALVGWVRAAICAGRHMFSANSAQPHPAKAAATAETPVPVAGPFYTSGQKATSDCVTVMSEDEGTAPRAHLGPGKGKRKALEIEDDKDLDLDEINEQLEQEFAMWGMKYQQAEGIMKEMKLEMDQYHVHVSGSDLSFTVPKEE
ncbi:hypothetical protein BDR06DRAFT_978023 [Suillus hirtellus]|nr:hypothetical protein BDR06DRAFT_978024 [Suillus hirtellus]KAG2045698.1 hypothetical protein BDR06DRAFT_978023 [Suillus hirtellus]